MRARAATRARNLAVAWSGQPALNQSASTFTSNHLRSMAEDPPATPRRQHGHSRVYILDRLKRENQTDLATAVEAGTVSAFAAAVQCGWTQRPPTLVAVTHQARKRRVGFQAIGDGELSSGQKMELIYGPNPTQGSLFSTREALELAWATCRDELLARANPGHRPAIWWMLEASGLGLEWPGYFNERSYLYKAGVLSAEEKAELEREWKTEFEVAQKANFLLNDGSGELLVGDCARQAHYAWADIPRELVKGWTTAARRRRARAQGASPEKAQEKTLNAASSVEGEEKNLRVE